MSHCYLKSLHWLLVLLVISISPTSGADETSHIISSSDNHKRLKRHLLRGESADPALLLKEIKAISENHHHNIEYLQKKVESGNYNGLSSDFKNILGDQAQGFSLDDDAVARMLSTSTIQESLNNAKDAIRSLKDLDEAPANHRVLKEEKKSNQYAKSHFISRSDMKQMKRASHKHHQHHQFTEILHRAIGNDPNRRLKVDSRIQSRRKVLESGPNQCGELCDRNNACDCLFKCIEKMSAYDFAVLSSNGYIETDTSESQYGNYSTFDFNAFNLGSGGLYQNYLNVQDKVKVGDSSNEAQCKDVLESLYSVCDTDDDGSQTCTDVNDQTYHLNVDQVCDAVNTDIKLMSQAIYEKFDKKKPNCLRVRTDSGDKDGGTVNVYVDYGNGYVKLSIEDYSYQPSEVIVDECFDTINGVRVSKTEEDDDDSFWVGFIEMSTAGKDAYSDFKCVDCCDDSHNPLCGDYTYWTSWEDTAYQKVLVASNDHTSGTPTYECPHGRTCTFRHDKQVNSECSVFVLKYTLCFLTALLHFNSKSQILRDNRL